MATPIERTFAALGRLAVGRPRTVLALALAAALLSIALATMHLTLRTSNLDLIDPELPDVRRFLALAEEFGTPNMLVVVLEGDEPQTLAEAVDRLTPTLARLDGVRGVMGRLVEAGDGPLRSPLAAAFPGAGLAPSDLYLTSRDRSLFFLLVQPADPRSNADTLAPMVASVRRALADAGLATRGIRSGLTGIPAYALDDRETIQRDAGRLSALSFALVLALFVTAFRSARRPLAVMAALVLGVSWTLGAVALYPGHLTLLSAFFASILFGLGVDFGIHLIDRIEELRARGADEAGAVQAALSAGARPLTTAALTSALVFFGLRLCGFRGFAELGLVAGLGVLLCLLAMVLVLPALLVLLPTRNIGAIDPSASAIDPSADPRRFGQWLARVQQPWLAAALLAVALAACLTGLAGYGPGFDGDYLHLQPRGSQAVRWEREMVRRSDLSPQFAAFVVDSRARALQLAERLRAEPTVGAVRSAGDLDLLEAATGRAVPASLRTLYESPAGHFAVYAFPRDDVWDPLHQQRFLGRMRAFDAQVTGMPLLGATMIERSRRALRAAAATSLAILALCLLADFRRPLPALLAAAPTLLTLAALPGLMRWLGLPFNPLNVMALPVVIGLAVDDGVHLVHRFLAEGGRLDATLTGTGRSVALTSLTTLAAFATLAFANHRGLASFALVLCLGVALALAFSLLLLPQLLRVARPWLWRAPAGTIVRRYPC